jgi:hypothetical protein
MDVFWVMMLISLAAVPLALTLAGSPRPHETSGSDRALLWMTWGLFNQRNELRASLR